MNRKISMLLITVMVLTVLTGCRDGGITGIGGKEYNGSTDLMKNVSVNMELTDEEMQDALSKDGNRKYCDFSMALFKAAMGDSFIQVCTSEDPGENESGFALEEPEDGNLLVSPLSVIYAMAMTANGSDGMTRCQLLMALTEGEFTGEAKCGTSSTGVGDIYDEYQDNLNNYLRAYMNLVNKNAETDAQKIRDWYGSEGKGMQTPVLSIANSIWFKKDPKLTVNDDFLETNGKYYNAGIREADFDGNTLKAINSWIEDHTAGLIKDMLKEIPESAIMYLINALAFEADWEETYDPDYQVHDGEFYGENGVSNVKYMSGQEYQYLEDELATGFIKPYLGGHYAFAALRPNNDVSLNEYILHLDGEHLYELLNQPIHHDVIATMPKFESKSSMKLVDAFKAMGVTDAFDVNVADFTKLGSYTENNIFIGNIFHDTYINVDERGTKAGAATIVEMLAEGAMAEEEPPKYVTLDRPFLYMIIDTDQHIPLFIGTIRDL